MLTVSGQGGLISKLMKQRGVVTMLSQAIHHSYEPTVTIRHQMKCICKDKLAGEVLIQVRWNNRPLQQGFKKI